MGKILTAFLLILLATTACAETAIREYDDHVVVEVTGAPQAPEEKEKQEQQGQINVLEYERQQLMAEHDRLNRKEDGTETMDARQRRAAMVEKSRRLQEIDGQMRELGYQKPQPQPTTDNNDSDPKEP